MHRPGGWRAWVEALASDPEIWFLVAMVLPILLVQTLLRDHPASGLVVVIAWAIEIVAYLAWRRRRMGGMQGIRRTGGPSPVAQAGWGCLGSIVIVLGLFVAGSSTWPSAGLGWGLVVLGGATIVWTGRRVARGSGDTVGDLVGREASILAGVAPRLISAVIVVAVLVALRTCTGNGT